MKLNRLTGFSLLALATAPVAACGPKPNPTCDSGVWSPVVNGCVRPCGTRENPTYDDCYDTDAGVFIEAGSDRDARADGAVMDAVSEAGRDVVSLPDADASMEAAVEAGPACTAPEVDCGGACVSPQSSVAHCGACGRACTTSVANARPVCAMGACDFECAAGFELVGAACEVRVPRAIGPMTSATVTSQRPTLEWALPTGVTMATVDLCRDRAMTMGCTTLSATGSTVRPASALTAGVWFWRVRGRANGTLGTRTSPVWWFRVGARSADGDRDTSWGSELDVNGDGFADVAVGSPGADASRGRVDVFYGSAMGVATLPSVTLSGDAASDTFGDAVANGGDINGDGFTELLVGASNAAPGGRLLAGRVYVYFGSASGLTSTSVLVLDGATRDDRFGIALGAAGDTNRDGFGEFVVGASFSSPMGRVFAGSATVFRGSAIRSSIAPMIVLAGAEAGDGFGYSVAGAGDVNGDRFADILVGSYQATPAGRGGAGIASIFLGGAMGVALTPNRVLEGVASADGFGSSVAGAGDVNGDGFSDVAIGAPALSFATPGSVSVFQGSIMGVAPSASRTLVGLATDQYFGISIGLGETNGDGYSDLVVGAMYASPSGRMAAGSAAVLLGSPTGVPVSPFVILEGSAAGDRFGASIALPGDVNGDGFGELAVGAPWAAPGGRNEAGTLSVFGGRAAGILRAPIRVLEGTTAGDQLSVCR